MTDHIRNSYRNASQAPLPVGEPSPAELQWSNQLLWALLEKKGQLVLSVVKHNEASAIRGFAAEMEYVDVKEVDALSSLVIYSRSVKDFKAITDVVDIVIRSRRRRAAASTPGARANGTRRTPATSEATKLTALGVAFVIGVAALGGVFAGVVISFGPYRE